MVTGPTIEYTHIHTHRHTHTHRERERERERVKGRPYKHKCSFPLYFSLSDTGVNYKESITKYITTVCWCVCVCVRSKRADDGGHACRAHVLLDLHLQQLQHHLHPGPLEEHPQTGVRMGADDCGQVGLSLSLSASLWFPPS